MNEPSTKSDQTNVFFPNFNFSKNFGSPELFDKENISNNMSPIYSDFRPPFLTLNFSASPVFRNHEDSKTPYETLSPKDTSSIFPEQKFKLKLNPKIQKRKKVDMTDLIDLGKTFGKKKQVLRVGGSKNYDDNEMGQNCPKNLLCATESTVHESNMKSESKSGLPKNGKFKEACFLNSDSENQEFKSKKFDPTKKTQNELQVKKLLKCEPLFCFFVRYFNDGNWMPVCDFEHEYELKIVKALMKPLGFKNPEMLNEDNFILESYLSTKPKSPVLTRNAFNFLMRVTYKRLKSLFVFNLRDEGLSTNQHKHLFFKHYFAEINQGNSNFDAFDFFDKGNLSSTKIEVILRTFKSKNFLKDVREFVQNEFKSVLDNYRTNKLHRLFLNWEQSFLDSKSEKEALNNILSEIKCPRFLWVYSDETYFQAFESYSKK